ncbi:MAG: beta-N-acetylhexosaminidase [Pseudomonadota bacterium]
MIMAGIEGLRLSKKERKFLREVRPAGVVYFKRNVRSPGQLRALSREIRKILGPGALIGIDQEGGRVARLGPPFTLFPGNDHLGRIFDRTGRTNLAVAQAKAMASELRAIGVNFNLIPVADVDSNPKNPVIGSRSFGRKPKHVAKLVAATVRACREAGILCCAKHFPGHGDTSTDSHYVLPVVRGSKRTIFTRELPPFRAAIRAGVPTMMSAHVIYPALDRKNSATLSSAIMKGLLRKKLGFRGVMVSDDLEMNAIALHSSVPEAGVRALKAGCDLLLLVKSLDLAWATYKRIAAALRCGELTETEAAASFARIGRLQKFVAHRAIKSLPRGSAYWPKHAKLAKKIEKLGGEVEPENFLGDGS